MNFRRLFVISIVFLSFPSVGFSVPVTLPTGIHPGDQYRLAFVTSTQTDGTSDNIGYYNDFVNDLANSIPDLAALNTSWTAIASTPTVNAFDNTHTNPNNPLDISVPIYNLHNSLVASSNSSLWSGRIVNDIKYDERGVDIHQTVFTGTRPNGMSNLSNSLGNTITGSVVAGASSQNDSHWIDINLVRGDIPHSLYALSGIITAPSSPPVSSTITVSLSDFQTSGVLGYSYNGAEVEYGSSGVFVLTTSNPVGALANLVSPTAYAFCDELTQNFTSTPELYNVGLPTDGNDPANALVGPINSFKEILLSELFSKFLDPSWYLPGPHTSDQITDAIAFHAAIEEIVHEAILSTADLSLLNLDTGLFKVESGYLLDHIDPSQLLPDVASRGQFFLDSLTGIDLHPKYQILQLTNPQYQDYLVAVAIPEIPTLGLLSVAVTICGIRGFLKKRNIST